MVSEPMFEMMAVKVKGNELMWRKVVERWYREVELVNKVGSASAVSDEEQRRVAAEEWKGRVKMSVEGGGVEVTAAVHWI